MWKLNRLLSLILLCTNLSLFGQVCSFTLEGKVIEEHSKQPIPFANIYILETQSGAAADESGEFQINSLCPENIHVRISRVGYHTIETFLNFNGDTNVVFYMDNNSEVLHELTISGEAHKEGTQKEQAISSSTLKESTNDNLANLLENLSGVSTIKNGSGISKPVVQGMTGNRLMILNNGITQSGQQWGADHSPEIDPLTANEIRVIKGVGAVEYQGSSLGNVILVEPKPIDLEPHLHGEARYFFQTNGLGNGLNLQLQKYGWLGWKVNGTIKRSGDNSTPDYYLRNTGVGEANLAIQLEKKIGKKIQTDVYLSTFNTQVGILRGSHVGNLNDLEEALERDVPFYTEENFSYDISAPNQRVNHHLAKAHLKLLITDRQSVDLTYAFQLNIREEYDVRRSGRSDKPALSLDQNTHFIEGKYKFHINDSWLFKVGIQRNSVENRNNPETGILPLIPDYNSYKTGVFTSLVFEKSHNRIELGGRMDVEDRRVATISNEIPRTIIRYDEVYQNGTAILGYSRKWNDKWSTSINGGIAMRNPEVNELYSNGLHQGVSGIEEGDPNLVAEKSGKLSISIDGHLTKKFLIGATGYYQNIRDYIFLNPQDSFRVTIRGTFPVFKYEQTDAQIYGVDLVGDYTFNNSWNVLGKYSFLRGDDLSNGIPLIYMPSNNLYFEVNYVIAEIKSWKNFTVQLNSKTVFEQTHLLEEQDYSPAPSTYHLLGAKISADRPLKKGSIHSYLRIDNALNQRYRDYLNRQRYFADDLGINFVLGFNFSF